MCGADFLALGAELRVCVFVYCSLLQPRVAYRQSTANLSLRVSHFYHTHRILVIDPIFSLKETPLSMLSAPTLPQPQIRMYVVRTSSKGSVNPARLFGHDPVSLVSLSVSSLYRFNFWSLRAKGLQDKRLKRERGIVHSTWDLRCIWCCVCTAQ